MSLSKPFPLLRLPRLPLFKIFNGIGVQEQFYLSICSSKAKYAIKFYNDRQKFFVAFDFSNTFAFYMRTANSDDEFHIDVHAAIFGSLWRFLSSIETSLKTPFEKNVKRLLLFLVDVFNRPAVCLYFVGRPQDFVTGIINYLHSLKLNIQSLKIESKKGEDKVVEFILENCGNASKVHLNCRTTTRFDYLNRSLIPKFNLDKLKIDYAEWVTTWHLTKLFINCKHLDFYNCSTDLIRVDQFIKKWVNGSSQLRYASLTFNVDFSMTDIMKGIPFTRVSPEEARWGFYLHISRTYRIKQQKS